MLGNATLRASIFLLSAFCVSGANAQNYAAHPYMKHGSVQTTDGSSSTKREGSLATALDAVSDAASRINLRIGLDLHQETYTEYGSGGKVMQEKGALYGLVLGANIPIGAQSSVDIEGLYATGESDYTGAYVGGNYGSVKFKGQDRKLSKLSATYKYRFKALGGAATGIGLDYRVLTDRLDQAGVAGYKRKNTATWAHLTLDSKLSMTNTWSVTPQAKVSYLLKATQTAEFGTGYKFKQDKGHGYELSVDFAGKVKIFNYKQGVSIKPYYRYMEVKDSKVSNGWYEPRNKTKEVGVQFGVWF